MSVQRRESLSRRAMDWISTPPTRTSGGSTWWFAVALAVFTVALYAPVIHHEFLNWDDPEYILENPYVTHGLSWASVSWALTSGAAANWHPLTWWSHMADVQLFGMNASAHHAMNLALHVVNTLLLFGVLHRMTGAAGRSAFVAALFGVHPLHVESVAWVAERKDVLSTLLWMLTLWAYVAYVRQPNWTRYLTVFVLLALGLMAKPMLVTLPFVLLLLDVWPLNRQTTWTTRVIEKLPLLALAVASSVITLTAQQQSGSIATVGALPISVRASNAIVSYVRYIAHMLWPAGLSAVYPLAHSVPVMAVIVSLCVLLAISAAVVLAAPKRPYLIVGWLWYLGTLVPVIGVVQVGLQAMADRYTYVPLVGLFIMIAWGVPQLLDEWTNRRAVLWTAATAAIAACAIVARAQIGYWRTSGELWQHAVNVTSDNYIAHNGYGRALSDEGRFDEAVAQFEEAVRINPGYWYAHSNLGVELRRQGRVGEAIAEYSAALRAKPDFAEARVNLGNALTAVNRYREAIAQYEEVLRANPDSAPAHNALGATLATEGRLDEALPQFGEAIRINPDSPDAYNNLALAFARQGRVAEATREFSEVLRRWPDHPVARRMLDELQRKR